MWAAFFLWSSQSEEKHTVRPPQCAGCGGLDLDLPGRFRSARLVCSESLVHKRSPFLFLRNPEDEHRIKGDWNRANALTCISLLSVSQLERSNPMLRQFPKLDFRPTSWTVTILQVWSCCLAVRSDHRPGARPASQVRSSNQRLLRRRTLQQSSDVDDRLQRRLELQC